MGPKILVVCMSRRLGIPFATYDGQVLRFRGLGSHVSCGNQLPSQTKALEPFKTTKTNAANKKIGQQQQKSACWAG